MVKKVIKSIKASKAILKAQRELKTKLTKKIVPVIAPIVEVSKIGIEPIKEVYFKPDNTDNTCDGCIHLHAEKGLGNCQRYKMSLDLTKINDRYDFIRPAMCVIHWHKEVLQ